MTFSPLYIHIPAHLLPGRLSFLLNRKLQPEVACQETVLEGDVGNVKSRDEAAVAQGVIAEEPAILEGCRGMVL